MRHYYQHNIVLCKPTYILQTDINEIAVTDNKANVTCKYCLLLLQGMKDDTDRISKQRVRFKRKPIQSKKNK